MHRQAAETRNDKRDVIGGRAKHIRKRREHKRVFYLSLAKSFGATQAYTTSSEAVNVNTRIDIRRHSASYCKAWIEDFE